MRQLVTSLTWFGIALAGCAGEAPDTPAGPDAGAGADAAPPISGQRVSGKTLDYFAPNTPMTDATITSDGIDPPMTTTSTTGGEFALDDVPVGSKLYFTVRRELYRPTRNTPVTVEGEPVTADLYLIAVADANRQYTTVGLPAPAPDAGTAILIAELRRNNGNPLVDIPAENITLVDANDQPVPGAVGPYFMGEVDVDPQLLVATAFDGRSRVALLDVPPGSYTLKVTHPNNQGGTNTLTVPVTLDANGATLAVTGGQDDDGGGGGNVMNPKFGMHVYPRLQKAAVGGLGCANCHTEGGLAGAVIQFDLPPDLVLQNMLARPGLIDLVTPAESLLLTKPLYEPPPYNHPNATFVDTNDPDYKLILQWISQGALL